MIAEDLRELFEYDDRADERLIRASRPSRLYLSEPRCAVQLLTSQSKNELRFEQTSETEGNQWNP